MVIKWLQFLRSLFPRQRTYTFGAFDITDRGMREIGKLF
jgi:hypothetical protein